MKTFPEGHELIPQVTQYLQVSDSNQLELLKICKLLKIIMSSAITKARNSDVSCAGHSGVLMFVDILPGVYTITCKGDCAF